MIVAVEGPSAAGKTTWCARQGLPVVAEYVPTGHEPDGEGQARYWTEVNAGRWREALDLERDSPVVLCDSDPLKLHYAWCLARVGAAPWSRFAAEARHTLAAFAAGRLGLADLVLVSIPPPAALRRRRDGDSSRRRRSFTLHATLAEPLREWYRAVDRAGPGRVVWSFPDDGLPATVDPRPHRSDPALLADVLAALPGAGDR